MMHWQMGKQKRPDDGRARCGGLQGGITALRRDLANHGHLCVAG